MPLYEYECGYCGTLFEAVVPIVRRHYARRCPVCDTFTGTFQEVPSSPARKQLLDRATMRKHTQPDEWDPALKPRSRTLGAREPIGVEDVERYADEHGVRLGRRGTK